MRALRTPPSILTACAPASGRKRPAFSTRLVGRRVGQERHVADNERVLGAADDRPRVMEHLVHRDPDLDS